jgi:nitrile hydratase subunit beta
MGGMHGFGTVVPEQNEPAFHADWERRVFALTVAMGATGEWNIDIGRFAREHRPPPEYLTKSYYELWLAGLERLLQERDLVSAEELTTGHSLGPRKALKRVLAAADVAAVLARGGGFSRPATMPARFAVGDRVRAKTINPPGHTRLPRYVRGRTGTVERVNGVHVFPDASAAGRGEDPQWLYTVRFEAGELWGADAACNLAISVDAFEPYLAHV